MSVRFPQSELLPTISDGTVALAEAKQGLLFDLSQILSSNFLLSG